MTLRGRITRLPFSTGNANLPKLIIYDTADILADILAWPSLRCFFDFSNRTTMVETGGLVASVADLTGRYTATAAVGARGTFNPDAHNGQPGLTCDGNQKYVVPALFPATERCSIAAAVKATDTTSTSRVFFADASDGNVNYFTLADQIRFMSGDVNLNVPSLRHRMVNMIATADYVTDACSIYSDGLSATATTTRAGPSGDANIAAWNDANAGGKFIGSLGYLAVFDEDLTHNATLRGLMDEYALRRWRLV